MITNLSASTFLILTTFLLPSQNTRAGRKRISAKCKGTTLDYSSIKILFLFNNQKSENKQKLCAYRHFHHTHKMCISTYCIIFWGLTVSVINQVYNSAVKTCSRLSHSHTHTHFPQHVWPEAKRFPPLNLKNQRGCFKLLVTAGF